MEIIIFSSILLWIIVLINFFLTLAIIRWINKKPDGRLETLQVGQIAPDFYGETITGKKVQLNDYSGNSLALVFISPDCGHCHKEIPHLIKLSSKANKCGTELILVCNADIAQVKDYVKEFDIKSTVISAPSQSNPFFRNYRAFAIPYYTIIDQLGIIQATNVLGDPMWIEYSQEWEKGCEI